MLWEVFRVEIVWLSGLPVPPVKLPPALNGEAADVDPGNFPVWSARLLGGCSRSRRDGLVYDDLCVSCLATEISWLRRRASAGKKTN